MHLRRHLPVPALAAEVETIWSFEGPEGIPAGGLNVGVPTGKGKLLLPFRGGLIAQLPGEAAHGLPEATLAVVGLLGKPVTLTATGAIGLLGVDFKPGAAHRFLPGPLHELTDRVWAGDDLFGPSASTLQQRLAEAASLPDRIRLLEAYLLARRAHARPGGAEWLVPYVIAELQRPAGPWGVEDLARRAGYSRRYLAQCFAAQVGVGPKTLASILRFQRFYHALAAGRPCPDWSERYHDQAHFIKEFRRFTGRAPAAYARHANAFGELFYR